MVGWGNSVVYMEMSDVVYKGRGLPPSVFRELKMVEKPTVYLTCPYHLFPDHVTKMLTWVCHFM